MSARLEIDDLSVHLAGTEGEVTLVQGVSLALASAQTLCIVGESGSGKTVTAMSVIRLLEFAAPVRMQGSIRLDGVDLVRLSPAAMRGLRGRRIGMVFQEALDSLNPALRIGRQLVEAWTGEGAPAHERPAQRALALLTEVGLPAERVMGLYAHQLSGGMQQRVMIALALMGRPAVLIADEPTTALDVTTQAEILALLARVQREHRMACIFITHDIAVAAQVADRIAVMYGGRVVEEGPAQDVLQTPRHRYTRALLRCVPPAGRVGVQSLPTIAGRVPSVSQVIAGCRFAPRCEHASARCRAEQPPLDPVGAAGARAACWHPGAGPVELPPQELRPAVGSEAAPPVLVIEDVSRVYAVRERAGAWRRRAVAAVDSLSLTVGRGEFFGLVGESGSGKSTLGRLVAGLDRPTRGRLRVGGLELTRSGLQGDERALRRFVQPVFQDPRSALDPRHTVARIIAEPLRELLGLRAGDGLRQRVHALMAEVGLPAALDTAIAAQLSGGQQQRVAIARAVAPEPELIVADEPTSALDVSVQGQVMNLLLALCRARGISFVFITHNLNLVLAVADRVGVMQNGRLLEVATPAAILATPRHDYTRRLLAANPVLPAVPAGPPPAMSSTPTKGPAR